MSTFSNGLKGNLSCQNKLINPQLIQIKSNLSTLYRTFNTSQNKDTYKINPKNKSRDEILSWKKLDIFHMSRLLYKNPNYLITCISIPDFITLGILCKTINIQSY